MFKASTIFYQIFVCHQMITLQKLWKMLLILSESSFHSHFQSIYNYFLTATSLCDLASQLANFCFVKQKISEIVYFSGKSFLWKIYFHELSCFASCIYHRRLRVFNKKCIWELKFLMFKASAIFYQIFVCHQMIALQELWKMLFISSKKLFFLKISKFLSSPLFLPVSHCFRDWWKINLKVCDVMNCLNKNLIYI